jgi:glucosamine-6-phosphate deaminase
VRVVVLKSLVDLSKRAADLVCELIRTNPDLCIALPSGKSPLGLYEELARRVAVREADLDGVTAFAIDELHGVPRDHPATNASYFAKHATRLGLGALHVMDSEADDADAECARFAAEIADAGGIDLAVLGIGVNGHLAFNEPGSPLDSRARLVRLAPSTREPYIEAFGSLDATPEFGLTLGVADLMAARRVLLLASGRSKAKAVADALEGPVTEDVPASVLQEHMDVTVLLVKEAAALLKKSYPAP